MSLPADVSGGPHPIYRPSVAAIVQDPNGRILIGERQDTAGAWQFPQGGLNPGEAPEAGLKRELHEELGLDPRQYVVRESRGPYRYLFPPGRTKQGFRGQEQTYFLLDWVDFDTTIDAKTEVPEFRQVRWILPTEFRIEWMPTMKQEVYRAVFRDFFSVEIS